MTLPQVAAIAFTVLLGVLAVFQAALVAGAPLGQLAWGGQDRVLTRSKRIGSVIAIVLYAGFALLVLTRAGLVLDAAENIVVVVLMWIVFGYLVLGVLMNAISRSRLERLVMTPTALVLAVLALILALG